MERVVKEFKISYAGMVKKAQSKDITSFKALTAVIRAKFPAVPQEFDVYYFDPDDRLELQNESDFKMLIEGFQKIKLFVKSKEEEYLSFANQEKGHISTQMPSSHQDKQVEESKMQRILEAAHYGITKEDKKEDLVLVESVEGINESMDPSQRSPMIQDHKTSIQQHKDPHTCHSCSQQLETQPYRRCLKCFDYQVCTKCFDSQKYKDSHKKRHSFVLIRTRDLLKHIDYRFSIQRLFDPDYKPQNDDIIRPPISESDLLKASSNSVEHLWVSSSNTAQQMLDIFREWQSGYNSQTDQSFEMSVMRL